MRRFTVDPTSSHASGRERARAPLRPMVRRAVLAVLCVSLASAGGAAGADRRDTVVLLRPSGGKYEFERVDARTLAPAGRRLAVQPDFVPYVSPGRRRVALAYRTTITIVDLERLGVAGSISTGHAVAEAAWRDDRTFVVLGGRPNACGGDRLPVLAVDAVRGRVLSTRCLPQAGGRLDFTHAAVLRGRPGFPLAVTPLVGPRLHSIPLTRIWVGARPWNARDGTPMPAEAAPSVYETRAHLAERTGVPAEAIRVVALLREEWPSSGLGGCRQGVFPAFHRGWSIVLAVAGRLYMYRHVVDKDWEQRAVPCYQRIPPAFTPAAPRPGAVAYADHPAMAVSPGGHRAVVIAAGARVADIDLELGRVRWRRALRRRPRVASATWLPGRGVLALRSEDGVERRAALVDPSSGRVRQLPLAASGTATMGRRALLYGSSTALLLDGTRATTIRVGAPVLRVDMTRRYAYAWVGAGLHRVRVIDLARKRLLPGTLHVPGSRDRAAVVLGP